MILVFILSVTYLEVNIKCVDSALAGPVGKYFPDAGLPT